MTDLSEEALLSALDKIKGPISIKPTTWTIQKEGKSMAGIGNNSNAQLKGYVERIERLSVQKMEIAEDIKDVFHEAKNAGFDVKALRTVLKNRRQNAAELAAHEATVAQYELALG